MDCMDTFVCEALPVCVTYSRLQPYGLFRTGVCVSVCVCVSVMWVMRHIAKVDDRCSQPIPLAVHHSQT